MTDLELGKLVYEGKECLSAEESIQELLTIAADLNVLLIVLVICHSEFGHSSPEILEGDDAIRFVDRVRPLIMAADLQRRCRT